MRGLGCANPTVQSLGKQFNFCDANRIGDLIQASDDSYALVLVLFYVTLLLQVISNVTRRLQDVLITVFDDLSGEGLGYWCLILWRLRFRRLISLLGLLVGLGHRGVPRGEGLWSRLRFLHSRPGN